MSEGKLGLGAFKGKPMVWFIGETRSGGDVTMNLCDPLLLHESLKEERRKGRIIRLPDHPTLKSPMGYPHMCYGKAGMCSNRCVKCIMDYYADEVLEAMARR